MLDALGGASLTSDVGANMPESAAISFRAVGPGVPEPLRHLRSLISTQLTELGMEHRCAESSGKKPIIRAWYGGSTNVQISAQPDPASLDGWTIECRAVLPWRDRLFMNRDTVKELEYLALWPYCVAIDNALSDDERFSFKTWRGWQRVLQQGDCTELPR